MMDITQLQVQVVMMNSTQLLLVYIMDHSKSHLPTKCKMLLTKLELTKASQLSKSCSIWYKTNQMD